MSFIDLSTEISGIRFPTPLFTASGTAGYGNEFMGTSHSFLGAFVTKGISLKPRKGNPPPRIYETPCGLLNAIGLENIGLEAFIKEIIPQFKHEEIPLVVNVFGETEKEFVEISSRLSVYREVKALELNVSCPNVHTGGVAFGQDPKFLFSLVKRTKAACPSLPLWVKLTPNVTDIVRMAQVVEDAGGDAITVVNSYPGIAVDCEREGFCLGNITGGLTGPAIKPLSQYAVWKVASKVALPVIASGGCSNATDALEYLLLGAKAVEIGTMALVDPNIFSEILNGIRDFLRSKNIYMLSQWIGRINEKVPRN